MSSHVPDEANQSLLDAARSGDGQALGELLENYRTYLRVLADQYLDARLQQRIDPADVVQVTFLEAQRDLGAFRGATVPEFTGWLRNILRNNLAAAVARHVIAQRRSIGREISQGPDSGADEAIAGIAATTTSPSGKVMRREAVAVLEAALERLPPAQAQALRLRYLEGLSLEEISRRLGKTDTATAGLLKRGLRKLREIMVDSIGFGNS